VLPSDSSEGGGQPILNIGHTAVGNDVASIELPQVVSGRRHVEMKESTPRRVQRARYYAGNRSCEGGARRC
jgi:hypothetical protein